FLRADTLQPQLLLRASGVRAWAADQGARRRGNGRHKAGRPSTGGRTGPSERTRGRFSSERAGCGTGRTFRRTAAAATAVTPIAATSASARRPENPVPPPLLDAMG